MLRFSQFLLLEEPMMTTHYDDGLGRAELKEKLPERAEKIHSIGESDIYHIEERKGYSTLVFCDKDTKNPHAKTKLVDTDFRTNLTPKTFKIRDTFSSKPKMNLYGKLFDTMVGEKGHILLSDDLLTPSAAKKWVSHIKEGKYNFSAVSPFQAEIPLHAGNIDEILPKLYGKNTDQANFNFKVSPKEKSE